MPDDKSRDEADINANCLEDCLKRLKINYERVGTSFHINNLFQIDNLTTGKTRRHFLIALGRGIVFLTDLEITVNDSSRMNLALALHNINDQIPYGDFEMTKNGTGITFKVSTFFETEKNVSIDNLFKNCISTTQLNVLKYREEIINLNQF